jgi:eukaryotic-like serine/threonine-protein kinase
MLNKVRNLYEFGPFRVDPDHRQLLRQNQPVPLQPKSFDILLVLVENSEKVVSKDELLKAVWPDTFVEESNLAQCIFVLRKTLGDTVEEKRYIVTVPGRGYRFAGTVRAVAVEEEQREAVERAEEKEDQIVLASRSLAKVTFERDKARDLRLWLVVGAMVAVVAVALGLYWQSQRKPKLTEKDLIVLGDFDNRTGDPVFDMALRQGLSAQLEQSPFLNLLSDTRIAQTLALMAQPKDARLTPTLAREVCERAACAASVEGSIASLGSQYVLGLKAVNCRSGDTLAEEQVTASGKEQVLGALGQAATKLREKLGESLASVEKYDAPPENVTTSSLEALQAFSLAYKECVVKGDFAAATPLFRRAISLDRNFAAAYAFLGVSYGDLGEFDQDAENVRKAYELRERVKSERERLYIDLRYASDVTGDLEAARKIDELWAETYPRDVYPSRNLGSSYSDLGEYDKALAAYEEALKLNPSSGLEYENLVAADLALNRLDQAKTTAREAQAHHLASPGINWLLYDVDFLQHDVAGTDREAADLMGKPGYEDSMLYIESDTTAYSGQFLKAREFTHRAVDSAGRADKKGAAAAYEAQAALREALVHNTGLAKQQARAALAISNGRDVEAISAIALGLVGDSDQAMRLANDLGQRFPKDTWAQSEYMPMIYAAALLGGRNASRDAGKAVEALAATLPYEEGAPRAGPPGNLNFALWPAYLRGEAYLATPQGSKAATEFQKILDHPGVVVNEPIGALAHLGLGRAYTLSHDSTKAKTEYRNFLSLWKDADPDIPILKQAKAEYAKLP